MEASLQKALRLEGINPTNKRFAFHEKTSVLIVRGGENIHALVDGLLASVAQNQVGATQQSATRELAETRIQLEAQHQANERLQQHLAKLEGETRVLVRENQLLEDSTAKK